MSTGAAGAGGGCLAAACPDVIDEVIDGEAVIVHLGTGRYYALNPSATALWSWLEGGRTPEEIADLVGAAGSDRAAAVASLLDQWNEHGLVSATDRPAPPGSGPPPAADGPAPEMRTFTDLQDLLLLDPIHDVEVGEDGFPVTRSPS